jgi:hypothetical protein
MLRLGQSNGVKISTNGNNMSLKKPSYNTTIAELAFTDYNGKLENGAEMKAQGKHAVQRTDRFEVDHLKKFFEEEMGAREVNHNHTMAATIR